MASSTYPIHAPLIPRSAWGRRVAVFAVIAIAIVLVFLLSDQNLAFAAILSAPAGGVGLVLVGARSRRRAVNRDISLIGDWDAFRREIDRSRRYERPLALAAASLPAMVEDLGAVADVMARARSVLRSVDVLWNEGSRLWILMPESDRDGGIAAIRRITQAAAPTAEARWRLVVFPNDALTTGALIAQLRRIAPLDPDSLSVGADA